MHRLNRERERESGRNLVGRKKEFWIWDNNSTRNGVGEGERKERYFVCFRGRQKVIKAEETKKNKKCFLNV